MKTSRKAKPSAAKIKDLATKKSSVRGGAVQSTVQLNQSSYSQVQATISNTLKAVSDTQSAIVANLKA